MPPLSPMDHFHLEYGRAADAWATLEYVLSMWFRELAGMQNNNAAFMSSRLFYSGRSFQTRRDLLRAALEETELDADTVAFFRAALKLSTTYSADRNRIAHRVFVQHRSPDVIRLHEGGILFDLADGTTITELQNMTANLGRLKRILLSCLPRHRNRVPPAEALRQLAELPTQAFSSPPDSNA